MSLFNNVGRYSFSLLLTREAHLFPSKVMAIAIFSVPQQFLCRILRIYMVLVIGLLLNSVNCLSLAEEKAGIFLCIMLTMFKLCFLSPAGICSLCEVQSNLCLIKSSYLWNL